MKLLVSTLVAVNLLLIGAVGYLFVNRPRPPGNASADPPESRPVDLASVSALGRIQPLGGTVAVNGMPGDRVAEVRVNLGQPVAVGDVLVTLSGEAERQLAVQTLEAQLSEADRARAALKRSTDARKRELDAEIAQAEAKAASDRAPLEARGRVVALQKARAEEEFNRLKDARSRGATVAAADLAQARSLVAQADAEAEAIAAQRTQADELLRIAKVTAEQKRLAADAEADRALAQVPSESLRAAIAAARQKAEAGRVLSPVAGRVVALDARVGTAVGMTPLLQIADTSQMMVLAEVYESDVPRLREQVKAGPVAATVSASALGPTTELRGRLTSPDQVAPMVARNQVFALGPREDIDRRVVEVRVPLEPASSEAVRDYSGLQVTIAFQPPARP